MPWVPPMRRFRPTCLASALWLAAVVATAGAQTPDYSRQIKPILKAHCYACHGALKQEGGLRLDTAAALLKGGDSGPAAIAGKPDASELVARVTSSDESVRMPQEAKPLSADEIDLIRRWI